ncbi:MAG: MATE family efflux transporter, partial [Sphaerochaetaceae bacterium]|nr:MATE family efflux transporter [Sphaerochaetaceae bacterium]
MKGKADLSKGSVEKNIMAIAIPMTLAEILHLLYNVVDRIFIGHIPGEGSLALPGIGICFPIISLITAFSKLYGANGGSPIFNIERGRGNDEEALSVQGNSLSLIVITGFILMMVGIIFAHP